MVFGSLYKITKREFTVGELRGGSNFIAKEIPSTGDVSKDGAKNTAGDNGYHVANLQ